MIASHEPDKPLVIAPPAPGRAVMACRCGQVMDLADMRRYEPPRREGHREQPRAPADRVLEVRGCMNISEAHDVAVLLDWLLNMSGPDGDPPPISDEARAAAAQLADRAYCALHAGPDGHTVRQAWPELPDLAAGALPTLHAALDLPDDDEPSGPSITTGDRL